MVGGFDLVMLINGEFNTFRPAEVQALLQKSHRALNKNGLLLLEPHTFTGVKQIADMPARWTARQSGLFSDRPHLWLRESIWGEESQTTITRHYIIDTDSAEVTGHAETLQAYSDEAYQQQLQAAGFSNIQHFASLAGKPLPGQEDLCVFVAQKGDQIENPTLN